METTSRNKPSFNAGLREQVTADQSILAFKNSDIT